MRKYLIATATALLIALAVTATRPAPTIGGEWCVPAAVAFAGYAIRSERRKQ